MASVTQTVPNFLGGVSNQPDDKKLPGQVKEAINAYPDPTFGLTKRPGFKFLTELKESGGAAFDNTDLDNAKWFYYNRDADERYVGCVVGNATTANAAIHVWNTIDLVKATINYSTTTYTIKESGNANSGNNGTYTGVDVTGGSGTGMKVTLTVNGGEVTVAAVHTEGSGYETGDVLTIPKANAGNTQVDPQLTIVTINSKAYLDSLNATEYDFLTIRDTSIITNKKRVVKTKVAPSHTGNTKGTLRVHLVEYSAKYQVKLTIGGTQTTVTYDTRAGDTAPSDASTTNFLSVIDILNALQTGLDAISGITATVIGSCIELVGTSAFTLDFITGGKGGESMTGYQDRVDSVSLLAGESTHDRTVEIINTASSADSYYAKFVANNGTSGPGVWEETIAPGVSEGLKPDTMPHKLYNSAKNVFSFEPITWAARAVGDDETNEHPAFAKDGDKTIQQAFYYNNRLGFLTDDNVEMSQSGEFFNFYMTTARTAVDNDPIGISCSSVRPATLHGIIPISSGLLLFSQNQQFLMFSTEGNLTPSTALIRGLSNYKTNPDIDPVDVGTSINFVSKTHDTAGFTRVFGMLPQGAGQAPRVVDIGRVVAEYIPATITNLTASPQNSFITMYGKSLDKMWFYRTYSDGERDLIQTWFNWQLPGNVQFAEADSDTMYSIIKTGTGSDARYNLCSATLTQTPEEEIIVTSTGQQVNPHMDFYTAASSVKSREVKTLTIAAGGSGYSSAPTLTIAAPPDGGVQATATCTVNAGAINAVTITNSGSGYPVAPVVTISGGGGSSGSITAAVDSYVGSRCYIPFKDVPGLTPVIIISGSVTNFSGTTESGFTINPDRATDGDGTYFKVPDKDLYSQAANVYVGYKYNYDITLPKLYYRQDARDQGKLTDYTAALTVARCKFSVGQSSVVGFKLKCKGIQAATQTFTGDGSNKIFSPDFDVIDKADVVVKKNGAIQTLTTDYTIANHASQPDNVTVTFVSAPAGVTTAANVTTPADTVEIYIDEWYILQPTQDANYYLGDDVPIEQQNIFTVPIHQRTENYTLRVFSDSPFPLALTSMSWEGNYSPRYYRRT